MVQNMLCGLKIFTNTKFTVNSVRYAIGKKKAGETYTEAQKYRIHRTINQIIHRRLAGENNIEGKI